MQIILIEDNEDDATLAKRTLRKLDNAPEVIWLKDGEDAYQFVNEEKDFEAPDFILPKLILLDLKLPKINGITLLAMIKNHPQFYQVPVVVMTSSNEKSDVDQCYRLGANSYVVKPIDYKTYKDTTQSIAEYWLGVNETPTQH